MAGLTRAICHLAADQDATSALVVTDCQSALRMLDKWTGFTDADAELTAAVTEYCSANALRKLQLVFSPGHAGVLANEFIDSAIPLMAQRHLSRVSPFVPGDAPVSRKAVKDAVKRKLESDENTVLGQLGRECGSASAPILIATGASRQRISTWKLALRPNRAAQCLLARIITNSGCFDRGRQLSCPHCEAPLSTEHILLNCAALRECREDVARHLDIRGPLTFNHLRTKTNLLPTLLLAALDSIQWMLQRPAHTTPEEQTRAQHTPTPST